MWWLAALGGFVLLWQGYGCEQRRHGELREKIRVAEQRAEFLESLSRRVDTVYAVRRDTLRITRRTTDSILLVDTILSVDTVRQIILTERQACDVLVETCEQRVAVRDSRIANLDSLLRLERKNRPGLMSKLPWLLGGALVGAVLLQ